MLPSKVYSRKSLYFRLGLLLPALFIVAMIPLLLLQARDYRRQCDMALHQFFARTSLTEGAIPDDEAFHYSYTPWSSIGGCGGCGSGGGAGDGIKWIGNGVSGGLIDVEVLTRYSTGQNFNTASMTPRLSFKPTPTTTVGVTVPISSKTAEVQYRSNQPAETRTTGGAGDVTLEFSKALGMSGEYLLCLGLTLPTGQYDIKRGADAAVEILPSILQKGTGVYNASFLLNYTRDVQDGMMLANANFNFPFAMRPFGKNEFLDSYFSVFRDSTQSRRFYYRFKPYGENDLGGYTPPSIGASVSYAYRGIENYVHSWTVVFSAPLGVAWVPSEKPGQYNPRPDPDHKAWTAALCYGLEFSRSKFPVFIGISLPIHDKTNAPGANEMDPTPMKKWDAPDLKDLFQQWTVAVGLKATMF